MPEDQRFSVAELDRRIANLIRPGRILEADYPAARVRVVAGGLESDWLPWLTPRAGGDIAWWAPEVGEQVLLLCPSGDPGQGWVLPAAYSDAAPAPADSAEVRIFTTADGAVESYDRQSRTRRVAVPDGGRILFEVGASSIEITGAAIRLRAATIELN